MRDKRSCASCIWYDEDCRCANGDSPYCGEEVNNNDVCPCWNSDGEEWRKI